MIFSDRLLNLAKEAEKALQERFEQFDNTAFINTQKVLDATI